MEKEGLSGAAAELHKENILSKIIFHLLAINFNFASKCCILNRALGESCRNKNNIWIVNDGNTNDWEHLK
jgi:hypothetical protein